MQFNLGTGSVTFTISAVVPLTGSQVNTTIGNVTVLADANVSVTGNEVVISTGTPTIVANALVAATGSALESCYRNGNNCRWSSYFCYRKST